MKHRAHRGFTLIEMVIAITLIGVLALAAAPLLRLPLAAWLDASRRAQLSQSLDGVQGKLVDDFRRALPNSVRIRQIGPRVLVETLEVRASGRHRAGPSGGAQVCPAVCAAPGANDALEAACSESCFTSLGALDGDAPLPGDWLVVNPLGPGVPGGDPYFGGNVAVGGGIKTRLQNMAAVPDGQRLRVAAHAFPALSASRRFYLVSTPVTWDCDPGTQRLTRRWGYPIAAVQPAAFGGGAAASPAATGVVACTVRYQAAGSAGRGGVLSFSVRIAQLAADTAVPEQVELVALLPVSEGP
jgi:MSHA biogenesis protein MshO